MKIIFWLALLVGSLIGLFFITNLIYNHFYSQGLTLPLLNQQQTTTSIEQQNHHDPKTVRVLIVDGGGLAGIIPIKIMQYLEKSSGKPASQLFDLFAGTSTGALIVTALNIPEKNGKPRFSATKLLDMYTQLSKKIMMQSPSRALFTLKGMFGPALSVDTLHHTLGDIIGTNLLFNDVLNKVELTAYNINTFHRKIFKNWQPQASRYRLYDLLTATSAAPIQFSPVSFQDPQHLLPKTTYIDGVLFSNNPTFYALQDMVKLYPNAKKYIIVHLGISGNIKHVAQEINFSSVAGWGLYKWSWPIFWIIFQSQNSEVHQGMVFIQKIIPKTRLEYIYFDEDVHIDAFDASQNNINHITQCATNIVAKNKKTLDYLAKTLSP